MKFPIEYQEKHFDCGLYCLKMISKYYNRQNSSDKNSYASLISNDGITLENLSKIAEHMGFSSIGARISFKELTSKINLPCIAHLNNNHYVVVYKVKNNKIYIADPDFGHKTYKKRDFLKSLVSEESCDGGKGICLLLEPI